MWCLNHFQLHTKSKRNYIQTHCIDCAYSKEPVISFQMWSRSATGARGSRKVEEGASSNMVSTMKRIRIVNSMTSTIMVGSPWFMTVMTCQEENEKKWFDCWKIFSGKCKCKGIWLSFFANMFSHYLVTINTQESVKLLFVGFPLTKLSMCK